MQSEALPLYQLNSATTMKALLQAECRKENLPLRMRTRNHSKDASEASAPLPLRWLGAADASLLFAASSFAAYSLCTYGPLPAFSLPLRDAVLLLALSPSMQTLCRSLFMFNLAWPAQMGC